MGLVTDAPSVRLAAPENPGQQDQEGIELEAASHHAEGQHPLREAVEITVMRCRSDGAESRAEPAVV